MYELTSTTWRTGTSSGISSTQWMGLKFMRTSTTGLLLLLVPSIVKDTETTDDGPASWFEITCTSWRQFTLLPMGVQLYSGPAHAVSIGTPTALREFFSM